MNTLRSTRVWQRQRGASLIEALLTTSIASVLTSAAVPAMTDAMTQQRLRAGSSELFATFNLARSEAIRRGSAVAVIPADARDWSSGWRVFVDDNDDGVQDPGEDTLVERPSAAASVTIRPYFGATYSGKVLSYSGEGRLHRPGAHRLVIGRLVLALDGATRSLCFASLGVRVVAAPTTSLKPLPLNPPEPTRTDNKRIQPVVLPEVTRSQPPFLARTVTLAPLAALPATLAVALGWLYSLSVRSTVPDAASAEAVVAINSNKPAGIK